MPIKKGDKLFSIYSDKIQSIQKELKVTKKINKKLYKSALDKLVSLDIDTKELKRIKNTNDSLEKYKRTLTYRCDSYEKKHQQ